MYFLISFGVCLIIGACSVLANFCTNFDSGDNLPPFKVRMKWVGWFSLFVCTFPISIPIGYIILIIVLVQKNKKKKIENTNEIYKREE